MIFELGMGEVDILDFMLLAEYKGPGSMEGGLLDCCWAGSCGGGLWKRITGEEMILCVLTIWGGFTMTFYVIVFDALWWNEKVPVNCGDKLWLLFKLLLSCLECCKF